jgi:hypothetical protein
MLASYLQYTILGNDGMIASKFGRKLFWAKNSSAKMSFTYMSEAIAEGIIGHTENLISKTKWNSMKNRH